LLETFPYLLASVALSVSAIVVAIRIYSANPRIELKIGSLIMSGGVIWLLMSALEVSSSNILTKLFFQEIHFVGLVIVPTSWLLLSMLISGYEKQVSRRTIVTLSVVPLISLFLVFTNEYHELIWTNVRLDAVNPLLPLDITYGLSYWLLIVGYSYVLLVMATILFVRRIVISRRLYRLQAFPLMIVVAIPFALDVIHQYYPYMFGYVAPTPVSLTIAASILMWQLIYLPGWDVVPVAHEMIIDNMNEVVIVLDWERRVVDLNRSGQALLGHTLQEVVARRIESVWTEWSTLRKALDAGIKEVLLESGGKQLIYELQTAQLARLGTTDAINLLIILRNITDRKILEEKLRLHSEHLEELVEQRTRELREAERMAAIGETAAMVGHDLRNPLQAISSATYLLKKSLDPTMLKQEEKMIGVIEESVKHSNRIVSDLLEYSREPKLKLDEVDLNQLLKEAVASAVVPEKIQVKLAESELRLVVDSEKIRRVFINIISNAIDAMPDGGLLAVEVRESKGSVEISFADTGTGISDQVMAKLWKPLNTNKATGSGLGLAICRRLVEAHNGSISAKSVPGKGTTIAITLPIKSMAKPAGEE